MRDARPVVPGELADQGGESTRNARRDCTVLQTGAGNACRRRTSWCSRSREDRRRSPSNHPCSRVSIWRSRKSKNGQVAVAANAHAVPAAAAPNFARKLPVDFPVDMARGGTTLCLQPPDFTAKSWIAKIELPRKLPIYWQLIILRCFGCLDRQIPSSRSMSSSPTFVRTA